MFTKDHLYLFPNLSTSTALFKKLGNLNKYYIEPKLNKLGSCMNTKLNYLERPDKGKS